MKRVVCMALSAGLSLGTPAFGEVWEYGEAECNQLWFMRNLIVDRAGYCFGSELGQALFNNGDCVGQDIRLSPAQEAQVGRIRGLERQIGCSVDTSATSLDVAYMGALRNLRDMALPDNGAALCTWAGSPVSLFDGAGAGSTAIGTMEAGDTVTFEWIGEEAASLLTISKGGRDGPTLLGWSPNGAVNFERDCTD
ncbi:MAG: YARHG domain-containing protein [Pseudomonadota bacterium]